MLWSKNEAAGTSAALVRDSHKDSERGLFYWQSNAGYLGLSDKSGDGKFTVQAGSSAIGFSAQSGAKWSKFDGTDPTQAARSLEALLGHAAFPAVVSNVATPRPLRARGDFVLHSAGPNEIFLANGGDENMDYRYLSSGAEVPEDWVDEEKGWLLLSDSDDIIIAGD